MAKKKKPKAKARPKKKRPAKPPRRVPTIPGVVEILRPGLPAALPPPVLPPPPPEILKEPPRPEPGRFRFRREVPGAEERPVPPPREARPGEGFYARHRPGGVPLKPGHEAPLPGERPSVERPAEEEIPAAAKPFRARSEVERPPILQPFEAYRPRKRPPRPELWEAVAKAAREEEEAMKPPAAAARPTAPWMRRPGAPPTAAPSPGAVPPWRRTGAAVPPVAPAPAPPSGPPPPVAARPALAPPRTTLDPEIWFPLDDLWGRVRALKAAPGFAAARGGIIIPISAAGRDLKTQAADAIAFFRIPPDFVQRTPEERWWEDLLRPFLEELERAIRSKAPADIKGDFQFAVAPDGTFGMLYLE